MDLNHLCADRNSYTSIHIDRNNWGHQLLIDAPNYYFLQSFGAQMTAALMYWFPASSLEETAEPRVRRRETNRVLPFAEGNRT